MTRNKPAAYIDNDPTTAKLGDSLRVFGDVPVSFFSSVEDFLGFHEIKLTDPKKLGKILESYSVLVCGNNFETIRNNQIWPRIPDIMGSTDFLNNHVGPIITKLKEPIRPMVIFLSPLNGRNSRLCEDHFWNNFKIVSFQKPNEICLMGINFRIQQELGLTLSRDQFRKKILRLPDEGVGVKSPESKLSTNLQIDYLFPPAKPLEWNELIINLARELQIGPTELLGRINQEVEIVQAEKEKNVGYAKNRERG